MLTIIASRRLTSGTLTSSTLISSARFLFDIFRYIYVVFVITVLALSFDDEVGSISPTAFIFFQNPWFGAQEMATHIRSYTLCLHCNPKDFQPSIAQKTQELVKDSYHITHITS